MDLQNHPMSICNESSMPIHHLSPPPPCCLGFFEILEDPIGRCKLLEQFTLAKRIISCWVPKKTTNTKQQATTINKKQQTLGESERLPLFHMKFYHPQIWPAIFFIWKPKTYKKVAPKPRGLGETNPKSLTNAMHAVCVRSHSGHQLVGSLEKNCHLWNPRFGPLNREEIEMLVI